MLLSNFKTIAKPNATINQTIKTLRMPTIKPRIIIRPSLFNSPNEINIIDIPGIEFANIIGVNVIPANIKIIAPIILSAIIDFIKTSLFLVNLSNLYKYIDDFSTITARVFLFILFSVINFGSQTCCRPIVIWNEKNITINPAIVGIGGGVGITNNKAKNNIINAKPPVLIDLSNTPIFISSSVFFAYKSLKIPLVLLSPENSALLKFFIDMYSFILDY